MGDAELMESKKNRDLWGSYLPDDCVKVSAVVTTGCVGALKFMMRLSNEKCFQNYIQYFPIKF